MSILTAVLHKEDDIYVAECPEVGTVGQDGCQTRRPVYRPGNKR